jgi:hypothetical protein
VLVTWSSPRDRLHQVAIYASERSEYCCSLSMTNNQVINILGLPVRSSSVTAYE